jgi:TonB-linked SusC/RagA family outer membrane protein
MKKRRIPFFLEKKFKLLLIMKLSTILLIVFTLNTYAEGFGQISINTEGKSILEILTTIERESNYRFFYNDDFLKIDKVDMNITDKNIFETLDLLLESSNYTYKLYDNNLIVISLNDSSISQVQPQQNTVRGTIVDVESNPLAGVSVSVKGTTNGTLSDINGNFLLENVSPESVLVFSFIGFKKQEMVLGSSSQVKVILEAELFDLDEVIVIGYGTQKKSDLTGSVTRVSMDKMNTMSNLNVSQALSGTVAGMNVSGTSGLAGSDPDISVRGKTSLSATDAPLIVLDGIIYNGSLSNINSNDVETIDILKDASSAAVYGSRSANGVMLITTRKGKSQKPVISFNAYFGYQDMTNNPVKVMNGEQYAIRNVDYSYQQSLYAWYATNPTSDAGKPVYPDISDPNVVALSLRYPEEPDNYLAGSEKEIHWMDEVVQLAPIQDYNLSISGKSDRVNYFVSGSYTDEKGIQIDDDFSRTTFRANLESDITDWLKIGFNSSYSFRDYSGRPASLSNAMTGSPWANNHIGSPIYDIDLCGEYWMHYPFDDTYVTDSDTRNNQVLVGRAIITVPWVKGLTWEFNYSNTIDRSNLNSFAPVTTREGQANSGYGMKQSTEEKSWLLNNIISYNRTFLNGHQVNATLLYSRDNTNANSTTAEASQFPIDVLGYNNLGLGAIPKASSSAWEENSVAYMARLNYVFKERYMFTGTVRRDGYSGFGEDNKFATFPSLSIAWVTSNEPFFKNLANWLFLKERISWGQNGNQGIGPYSSFSRMATTNYVYGPSSTGAIYPSTLGNSSLKWEETTSLNFGIDWGLFDRRISGSFDFYSAKTDNVLVQRSLPSTTGYSSVWENLGQLGNKGFEMELTSKNLTGTLTWETTFVFALNKDKILDLYGDENDSDIGNSWFVGEPISAIYDYEMVDGTVWTEDDLYSGNILPGWYPGQFKLVDQNDDGKIDPNDDRKVIGYSDPLYRFSINNTLSYKHFTLSFFINSIQGGDKYYLMNNSYFLLIPGGDAAYRMNQFAIRQYWTPDNGVTNANGMFINPPRTAGLYQSRSFVRLQDVSISYTLDESILKKLKLTACQFYIASKNPYTWTKWDGFDPENAIKNPDRLRGYYASMRNITAGIRITL